ncbi:hypothetical protein M2306_003055 [Myroides gitamensis]|uniref:hypothetical protein n=1 Tax=Myroides odoratus TaxID=256 RepID=UPI002166C869|nr:hypothetical protein [Myroides odoratus]MCS4239259.1 hypothetical protein [Myroides odoratus]MDH6602361.1 hypothetical protein [Myroides gitamensis]
MMIKLTPLQIQTIDERLRQKYELKYEEFRSELLDHIACDIEELMEQGEPYEEATILVFRKWNVKLLSNTKGFYKGIPHFILDQINATYKKTEIKLLGFALLFGLILIVSEKYLVFDLQLVLYSLFVINAVGVVLIYQELKGLQDYRYDFFKSKSLVVLLQSGAALVGIQTFYFAWDIGTSSLEILVIYYFLLNTYLLYRFRTYSKYQKLKIAKIK